MLISMILCTIHSTRLMLIVDGYVKARVEERQTLVSKLSKVNGYGCIEWSGAVPW